MAIVLSHHSVSQKINRQTAERLRHSASSEHESLFIDWLRKRSTWSSLATVVTPAPARLLIVNAMMNTFTCGQGSADYHFDLILLELFFPHSFTVI